MIVLIDKSLEKDVRKLSNKSVKKALFELINSLREVSDIDQISGVKKLQGYKNYFRIRIGDYRLGVIVEKNEIQLIRLLHRKEIYRFFP